MNTSLEPVTSLQLLQSARLDWDVEKRPAYRKLRNGNLVPWTGHWDICRSDTEQSLGHVLSDYKPLANRAAFSFGDLLVEAGTARWVAAAQTYDCVNVIMILAMTREYLAAGEPHRMHLVITTSHNGSSATKGFAIPVHLQSQTQTAASLAAWLAGIRHSGDWQEKSRAALAMRDEGDAAIASHQETILRLSETQVSDAKARELTAALTGTATGAAAARCEAILALYHDDNEIKKWRGTGLGLLLATNVHAAHYARYRTAQARYAAMRGMAQASEKLVKRLLPV